MNPATRKAQYVICPSCQRSFLFDETATPPFCSERCQLIDLGRWLDEEIGVPTEGGNQEVHYRADDTGDEES